MRRSATTGTPPGFHVTEKSRRSPPRCQTTSEAQIIRRANKKGPAFAGPFVRLRYATRLVISSGAARPEDGGALIAVGRGNGGRVRSVDLGHHALDLRLAHGERNLGAAEAQVSEFAVAHAEQLGLGGARLVVGFDGCHNALGLPVEP